MDQLHSAWSRVVVIVVTQSLLASGRHNEEAHDSALTEQRLTAWSCRVTDQQSVAWVQVGLGI